MPRWPENTKTKCDVCGAIKRYAEIDHAPWCQNRPDKFPGQDPIEVNAEHWIAAAMQHLVDIKKMELAASHNLLAILEKVKADAASWDDLKAKVNDEHGNSSE